MRLEMVQLNRRSKPRASSIVNRVLTIEPQGLDAQDGQTHPSDHHGHCRPLGSPVLRPAAGVSAVLTAPSRSRSVCSQIHPRAGSPRLHLAPRALYWGPRLAAEVYGEKNLHITGNGCGYDDDAVRGGESQDLHRVEYLRSYLRELHRAIAEVTPVRGYFLWSFLDNFERADGYRRRFGILHNNFKTQRRTPKPSARWYSSVAAANREQPSAMNFYRWVTLLTAAMLVVPPLASAPLPAADPVKLGFA